MNCSLLVSAIRPFDFFSSYFLKARSVLLIALAWDSCYQGIAFSGDVLVRKADIRDYSKYCLKKEENTNHTSPS
jgi:hypothetical protein